jgi:hypothetical protein
MKGTRLSALRTGRLKPPSPQETFLELISARSWVVPRAIVQPEGSCQWKIPMTPCSIVLQSTAKPHASQKWKQWHKTNEVIKYTSSILWYFWRKRRYSKVIYENRVISVHLRLINEEDTLLWQFKTDVKTQKASEVKISCKKLLQTEPYSRCRLN